MQREAPPRVSAEEIEVALRVLGACAPPRERHAEEPMEVSNLRKRLLPAVQAVVRREKQQQRYARKEQYDGGENASATASHVEDPVTTTAVIQQRPDFVQVGSAHLSRILYPNPVCFLSTWMPERRDVSNLMTISWLAPLDNDGHFLLSMNQRRFSARLLAANPILVLSTAVAGLEQQLLRVGGCSGERVTDKAGVLGIPLVRPGWHPCESAAVSHGSPAEPTRVEQQPVVQQQQEQTCACIQAGGDGPPVVSAARTSGQGGGGSTPWPLDGEPELHLPPLAAVDLEQSMATAVAVAPCAAHVVAQVKTVRAIHGHYVLTCDTLRAFVRSDYWSGKTFEPQREDVPPLLSFVGSQRFCWTSVPSSQQTSK